MLKSTTREGACIVSCCTIILAVSCMPYFHRDVTESRIGKTWISEYYNSKLYENITAVIHGDSPHRTYSGPFWEEEGAWQLQFLVSQGLLQHHMLLDMACGSLSGGVRYVDYLDDAHYFGIDLNMEIMSAGYEEELIPRGLAEKLPRSHLYANDAFDAVHWGYKKFDFAVSHSLWTHIPLDEIRSFLKGVGPAMKTGGRLYATFNLCPEAADCSLPIVQFTYPVQEAYRHSGIAPFGKKNISQISTSSADPYHYRPSELLAVVTSLGLEGRYIDNELVSACPWKQKVLEVTF